jgi:hypothetical protein
MTPQAVLPMILSLRIVLLAALGIGVAVVGFLLGTSLYELDRSITQHGLQALVPWFLRAL